MLLLFSSQGTTMNSKFQDLQSSKKLEGSTYELSLSKPQLVPIGNNIHRLHSPMGNQSTRQALKAVNAVKNVESGDEGDRFEMEADQNVDQNIRGTNSTDPIDIGDIFQTQNSVQRMLASEHSKTIKVTPYSNVNSNRFINGKNRRAKNFGSRLPENLRTNMERQFGFDFSKVRVQF